MNAIGGQTSARRGRWTGAERRAQVAAVTLDVIAREGVHGASLARIAEVAGITAPSLYNHFSGRTEILEAASDLLLERVLAWIDSSTNPNMLERLREIGGSIHESRIGADQEWVIAPLLELTAAARTEGLTEHMGSNQLVILQKICQISSKRESARAPSGKTQTRKSSAGVSWDSVGQRTSRCSRASASSSKAGRRTRS